MNSFSFRLGIRFIILGVMAAIFIPIMILGCAFMAIGNIEKISDYKHRYGDTWEQHLETDHVGGVKTARQQIIVGIFGSLALTGASIYAIRVIRANKPGRPMNAPSSKRHRRRRHTSSLSPPG
jgi:hypothetical protein